MALTSGTRFGAYEITAPLGAGGMGEVYRARDTSLKRDVAIKVLPASVASDADRLARLQREAELLAALNHPNIAQIYGLEKSAGTTALVMELVAGQSLVERVTRGPLPLEEALSIAGQIADALEAAHERGIVHRDLKPSNVQLTADGKVKVLDFGIAKALDPRVTGPGPAALTTPAMTEAGIVLGTAAYMSPEQARGRPVDQRADIWAFGCVLYELLTGQFAFPGDDVTIVLARVLERSPDFAALPASTPPAVRRTLELCLEKDPRKRIADIRDVKLALAGQFAPPAPPAEAPVHRSATARWRHALPVAVAALALGALGAGFAAWNLKPDSRPVVRGVHVLPEGRVLRLLTGRAVAIAPNGNAFLYNAEAGLYLRSLDSLEDRLLLSAENAAFAGSPTFSPDGQWIAYNGGGQLRRIGVSGGGSVALAPVVNAVGISWEANGTILYGQGRDGIWQVPDTGGEPRQAVAVEGGFAFSPQRLPGGEWILFTFVRDQGGVTGTRTDAFESRVASVTTGEQRTLRTNGSASGARYVATGHLLYANGGVLYAAPFDTRRLELTGGAVPVIEGVRLVAPTGVPQFDVADSGALVYLPGPAQGGDGQLSLLLGDRGGLATPVNAPTGDYVHVRASPDGERVALDSDEDGEAIIWIYELAGTRAMQRLTLEGRNQYPVWSPDGERLAFQSTRGGDAALWAQRVDGTSAAQRLTTPAAGELHIPEAWSPDGRYLAFAVQRDREYSLALLSLSDGTVAPFGDVESMEPIGATFSSDGRWIAYHSLPVGAGAESPRGGVFVEPFPPTGARYQVPKDYRDFQAVWSRDGLELYYIPATVQQQIAAVRVSTERGLSFDAPANFPFLLGAQRLSSQTRAFDVLPNSRFIGLGSGDVDDALAPQIRFVLNWFEELKRLVPAE